VWALSFLAPLFVLFKAAELLTLLLDELVLLLGVLAELGAVLPAVLLLAGWSELLALDVVLVEADEALLLLVVEEDPFGEVLFTLFGCCVCGCFLEEPSLEGLVLPVVELVLDGLVALLVAGFLSELLLLLLVVDPAREAGSKHS
jgi:hypothetical protein